MRARGFVSRLLTWRAERRVAVEGDVVSFAELNQLRDLRVGHGLVRMKTILRHRRHNDPAIAAVFHLVLQLLEVVRVPICDTDRPRQPRVVVIHPARTTHARMRTEGAARHWARCGEERGGRAG